MRRCRFGSGLAGEAGTEEVLRTGLAGTVSSREVAKVPEHCCLSLRVLSLRWSEPQWLCQLQLLDCVWTKIQTCLHRAQTSKFADCVTGRTVLTPGTVLGQLLTRKGQHNLY